jgi:hypothetical protein
MVTLWVTVECPPPHEYLIISTAPLEEISYGLRCPNGQMILGDVCREEFERACGHKLEEGWSYPFKIMLEDI